MAFTSIRVMTYNVSRGRGRSQGVDPDALLAVIAGAAPDVVALQGIDCRPEGLGRLADQLGMRSYAAGEGATGTAFLSFYPLRGIERHPLDGEGECLRADLELGQKRMSLYNIRVGQSRDTAPSMESLFGDDLLGGRRGGLPSLLLGDFGMTFVDPTWRCQRFGHPLRRVGSPLFHGTYPSYLPLFCRDRAYLYGDLQTLGVSVVRDRQARQSALHLPFLVTVRIIDPRHYLKVETPSPVGMEAAPG